MTDINVYKGSPYQRGFGFGSLFKRFEIPILKFIGKHALKAGINIGQDILEKKKVKEAKVFDDYWKDTFVTQSCNDCFSSSDSQIPLMGDKIVLRVTNDLFPHVYFTRWSV